MAFLLFLFIDLILIILSCFFLFFDKCDPNIEGSCHLVKECQIGCRSPIIQYTVCAVNLFICFLFMAPASLLTFVQLKNFMASKTTNERFAKNRTASGVSGATESFTSSISDSAVVEQLLQGKTGDEILSKRSSFKTRGKRNCFGNIFAFCCKRRILNQEELLKIHLQGA